MQFKYSESCTEHVHTGLGYLNGANASEIALKVATVICNVNKTYALNNVPQELRTLIITSLKAKQLKGPSRMGIFYLMYGDRQPFEFIDNLHSPAVSHLEY